MPVRFRCKHCHQLLGIARRKIGTEVRCPECRKMVLVPAVDAPDVDEPTRKRDVLFEGAVADRGGDPPKEASGPTFSPAAPEAFDAELYRLPEPAAGVFLSTWHATLLFLAVLFIVVLAFTAGLLFDRYVL
jgi:biopolymer transport protein ExbD